MGEIFKDIPVVKYEGKSSKNPLSFFRIAGVLLFSIIVH